MIELPWQIVAVFAAYLIVDRVLRHFRVSDCEERIRAAENQTRRDTINAYRSTYQAGWTHGCEDSTEHSKGHDE